jgi:hypothetical protein
VTRRIIESESARWAIGGESPDVASESSPSQRSQVEPEANGASELRARLLVARTLGCQWASASLRVTHPRLGCGPSNSRDLFTCRISTQGKNSE